ncbi:LuxR C-terminal-related transcriptional regulator [Atopobiaceae bacterium 24-176]
MPDELADRALGHAAALALGLAAQLLSPSLAPSAPALLAALCLACAFDLARPRWRDAATAATFLLLALWPSFAAFGPLTAALAAASRHRWARVAWTVPAAVSWLPMEPAVAAGLAVLAGTAWLISMRSEAATAERSALKALRDGLRERVIALGERNSALANEAAQASGATASEAALEGLTDRERSVLSLVAEGLDNREVAGRLYLSEGTVRNHVSAILRKKQLHNRAQLISLYYRGPAGDTC